jgi:8-oxo-dGTP pyrophosphatase MutT (NUDIX family)
MAEEVRLRRVARLIVDAVDRVLLFDTQLAYTRVWMTPGGALETGENYEEAAVRELWEETGFKIEVPGGCVWTCDFRFRYHGVVYDQRERYYLVRVEMTELVSANWQVEERDEINAWRWWSIHEIASSSAQFRPANLATLLSATLDGELSHMPISAPVEAGAVTE